MIPGISLERPPDRNGNACQCCPGPVPQDMFEILVNGIFAFVMTLIVKNNFPLPRYIPGDDLPFLIQYIDQVTSDGIVFVFTFVMMVIFYILFFEMLRHMRVLDRGFVYLSFGYLLSLVFIPLTSLLWTYSDVNIPYAVLFHANILISGVMMVILWRHASRFERLLLPKTAPGIVSNLSIRLMLLPITAVAGLLLDWLDVSFGEIPITVLYAIPVIAFVVLSRDT
ncbi:MAG: TMEM175 family protein [Methanolinea sp.]|jgi:uncharacterized membrane protein|nr:TMEM175 family protein [Methanolinea sp.]